MNEGVQVMEWRLMASPDISNLMQEMLRLHEDGSFSLNLIISFITPFNRLRLQLVKAQCAPHPGTR